MKAVLLLFLVLGAALRAEPRYSGSVRYVIAQLKEEKTPDGEALVSGRAASYGGRHGAFFMLAPYVCARATSEDLTLMLKDASPLIRILAAKRISMHMIPTYRPEAMASLLDDHARVYIGPLDEETDEYRHMTVADVVRELQKNRCFLPLAFDHEEPNQSPEPMPPSVTPRAEPRVAPAAGMAHL